MFVILHFCKCSTCLCCVPSRFRRWRRTWMSFTTAWRCTTPVTVGLRWKRPRAFSAHPNQSLGKKLQGGFYFRSLTRGSCTVSFLKNMKARLDFIKKASKKASTVLEKHSLNR
uniref:Uncharacterized protein n=1 Tax=Oryzias latipes TaxID=8090 RepID=A0A3P9K869_ORYLA